MPTASTSSQPNQAKQNSDSLAGGLLGGTSLKEADGRVDGALPGKGPEDKIDHQEESSDGSG